MFRLHNLATWHGKPFDMARTNSPLELENPSIVRQSGDRHGMYISAKLVMQSPIIYKNVPVLLVSSAFVENASKIPRGFSNAQWVRNSGFIRPEAIAPKLPPGWASAQAGPIFRRIGEVGLWHGIYGSTWINFLILFASVLIDLGSVLIHEFWDFSMVWWAVVCAITFFANSGLGWLAAIWITGWRRQHVLLPSQGREREAYDGMNYFRFHQITRVWEKTAQQEEDVRDVLCFNAIETMFEGAWHGLLDAYVNLLLAHLAHS